MARRLIGSGTTDANGKVTVSYTGTGAGKLQLVATCGEVTSDSYDLIDATFRDIGTSAKYTAWSGSSNMTVARDSETTLTPQGTFSTYYQNFTLTDYMVFEFDVSITYSSATNFISFRESATARNNFTQGNLGLTSGQWSHIKLVIDNNKITPYVDGVEKTASNITTDLNRFYFVLNNASASNLEYKNFVIY